MFSRKHRKESPTSANERRSQKHGSHSVTMQQVPQPPPRPPNLMPGSPNSPVYLYEGYWSPTISSMAGQRGRQSSSPFEGASSPTNRVSTEVPIGPFSPAHMFGGGGGGGGGGCAPSSSVSTKKQSSSSSVASKIQALENRLNSSRVECEQLKMCLLKAAEDYDRLQKQSRSNDEYEQSLQQIQRTIAAMQRRYSESEHIQQKITGIIRENSQLKEEIEQMRNQLMNVRMENQNSVAHLLDQFHHLESQNLRLVSINETIKSQYESFVQHIAGHVVQGSILRKNMCQELKQVMRRVRQLEEQNDELRKEMHQRATMDAEMLNHYRLTTMSAAMSSGAGESSSEPQTLFPDQLNHYNSHVNDDAQPWQRLCWTECDIITSTPLHHQHHVLHTSGSLLQQQQKQQFHSTQDHFPIVRTPSEPGSSSAVENRMEDKIMNNNHDVAAAAAGKELHNNKATSTLQNEKQETFSELKSPLRKCCSESRVSQSHQESTSTSVLQSANNLLNQLADDDNVDMYIDDDLDNQAAFYESYVNLEEQVQESFVHLTNGRSESSS